MDYRVFYCPMCGWWCDIHEDKMDLFKHMSYCQLCRTELVEDLSEIDEEIEND